MADAPQIPDEAETRARWGAFAWTAENAAKAKAVIARYPAGRQRSAVMPLLDLAQRQVGAETQTQGWLPVPVIEYVAAQLDMPFMRAYEVASFYTMYKWPMSESLPPTPNTAQTAAQTAAQTIDETRAALHQGSVEMYEDAELYDHEFSRRRHDVAWYRQLAADMTSVHRRTL